MRNRLFLILNSKQEKTLMQKDMLKKQMVTSHYKDINAQIKQTAGLRRSIDSNIFEYEKEDMDQRVMSSLDYQAMERMEKTKKQQMYKDILTYQ